MAYVENGKIQTLYDLKFPGDPAMAEGDPQRLQDYEDIAEKNEADFVEFNVEERCKCGDKEKQESNVWGKVRVGALVLLIVVAVFTEQPEIFVPASRLALKLVE